MKLKIVDLHKIGARVKLASVPTRTRSIACLLAISFSSQTLFGASTIEVKSEGNLEAYTKLYLAPIKRDTSKVYPRLLTRLQKAGFDVVELKLENLPFASQGSGFVISPQGYVLTCAHVVGDQTNATLWIEGARHVGKVIAADTNVDAAIVLVEGSHAIFHTLAFAREMQYQMGQDAFTLGFPLADFLGNKPRLNKGLISSTVGLHDDPTTLQISAEVQPGNSGGPLLNAHAQVIGMVAATLNPMKMLLATGGQLPQNVNFALKNGPIRGLLASWKVPVPDETNAPSVQSFEEASKALALIRGGIVDETRLRENPLVCTCSYIATANNHFAGLRLTFVDVKKLRLVLLANQETYVSLSENALLDVMFEEICAKAFPDKPNPFSSKKRKS